MKTPTWPEVALLAVFLAAIILSYAFVAPAAGVVTGIVTTIIGSLFLPGKGGNGAGLTTGTGTFIKYSDIKDAVDMAHAPKDGQ